MKKSAKNDVLNGDEISQEVYRRLAKYKDLNMLEHFAMFMGKAQILEYGLKNLAAEKYGFEHEQMDRWTLGWTTKQLKTKGLRPDFILLLEKVVEYRNYIAHEFLANESILRSVLGGDSGTLELKQLMKGSYELEQIIFLFDWCTEKNAW